MRENHCKSCDGTKRIVLGVKCNQCSEYGIDTINKDKIICPCCGYDDFKLKLNKKIESCPQCRRDFLVNLRVTTYVKVGD